MTQRSNPFILHQLQSPQVTPTVPEHPFEYWLHKNQIQMKKTTPIRIEQSFQNLEQPLAYIRDSSIINLENYTKAIQSNMLYEREAIAQMSKNTYKKVISRDQVDYQFGRKANNSAFSFKSGYNDYQKREAKKKEDNTQLLMQKREELSKNFIHNEHQSETEQANIAKPLTIEAIKAIDTKDYEEKYKGMDLYEVFLRKHEEKYISAIGDISENYFMDENLSKLKFSLIDRDSHYSSKSNQYLFKAEQELDFWRRYSNDSPDQINNDEIQLMKRCQNFNPKLPTYLNLLDFASNKLDSQTIFLYLQLKNKQEAELKIDENDENLEGEYNKKKEDLDFLREMRMKDKTQIIAIKYTENNAQTIDNMEDQSFDSYFEEAGKNLLMRLKELNEVRDSIMERDDKEAVKKVMLINIGHEIKGILFKLLSMTLKGEDFVNYHQLMNLPDEAEAQRKILEIVYHDFHKIKNLEVDGISKTKILDIYLQEREKNEKMFELLGRLYAPEKSSTSSKTQKKSAASKTPVKLNNNNSKPNTKNAKNK